MQVWWLGAICQCTICSRFVSNCLPLTFILNSTIKYFWKTDCLKRFISSFVTFQFILWTCPARVPSCYSHSPYGAILKSEISKFNWGYFMLCTRSKHVVLSKKYVFVLYACFDTNRTNLMMTCLLIQSRHKNGKEKKTPYRGNCLGTKRQNY